MHWRKTFGEPIVRAVSSFSLALLAALALATDYARLEANLASTNDTESRFQILKSAAGAGDFDHELSQLVTYAESVNGQQRKESVDRAVEAVAIRAALQRAPEISNSAQTRASANRIKANPLYRDAGADQSSNWIARAFSRIFENVRLRPPAPPRIPAVGGLDWFVTAIWVILGILLALALYFALRHFNWKRGLKRKARTLLEEHEPERTLDEWLRLAEIFAGEGDYRKAVRCLYLACLLEFDERGVARFDRGETNWEHLSRIQRSALFPKGLDFRAPTEAFDRIWYGFKVRGMADVDDFRNWYNQVVSALKEKAA